MWFTKSANAGYSFAQNSLGKCYKHGRGVAKNKTKSFEWFTKSANNQTILDRNSCIKTVEGVVEAQFNLAQMNHYGLGTEKNMFWKEKDRFFRQKMDS